MIYFIPAWYQKDSWRENEQSWHIRRMHSEFDDTVKQIQLFHRSKAYPFRIMLLGYSPNFRHFLHRQSIYHARYWSCFDAIQEVRREKARLLSFHNLNWPEGIEFVYTPFVIVALQKKEKYAQIEFGEDGNPIRVDLYKGTKVSRSNVYDDRGFLSASTVYENGEAVYQDYLMENGMRKMRHFFPTVMWRLMENALIICWIIMEKSRSEHFQRQFMRVWKRSFLKCCLPIFR